MSPFQHDWASKQDQFSPRPTVSPTGTGPRAGRRKSLEVASRNDDLVPLYLRQKEPSKEDKMHDRKSFRFKVGGLMARLAVSLKQDHTHDRDDTVEGHSVEGQAKEGPPGDPSKPRTLLSQYTRTPGYWTDEMAVYPHFSRRMQLNLTGVHRGRFHYDPSSEAHHDRAADALERVDGNTAGPPHWARTLREYD